MQKPIRVLLAKYFWVVSIAITLFIAWISLIDPKNLPPVNFSFSDKVAHCLAYFALALTWFFALFFKTVTKKQVLKQTLLFLGLVLYGIFIEFLQDRLTTYRTFDYYDMLANSIGILIGFTIFRIFQQRFVNLLET